MVAVGIKGANQLTEKKRDHPGLCSGPTVITKVLKRGR